MSSYASATLSSPAFYTPALFALEKSGKDSAISIARLSSGNRLQYAADNVADFSIAARLQAQLSGLRQASQNAVLGSSLLQVANGGLTQIGDILDRMKSLATQSNSASLSDTERSYLQAEFAQYLTQIDSLTSTTKFNNMRLIDGSFSGENDATTQTTTATKATGTLNFSAISNGNTVKLNGVTLTAGTDFTVGGSVSVTVDNLVEALNASTNTALSGVSYQKSGSSAIILTAKSGGALGNQFYIDQNGSTATFTTVGASTAATNVFTLANGTNNGLGINSTRVSGTIGDSLINTQSQTSASVTFTLNGTVSNGELLRIDNGNGGYVNFTFATTASASTDIQIGSTTEETLQNIAKTLSQYSASNDYGVRQLSTRISGNSIILSNRTIGNPTSLSGSNLAIATTATNGILSASSFSNGTNTGVNASGINNASFTGSIQGFTATYNSANNITARITVGDITYSSTISSTNPVSATTVRFSSATGGYFDVQLAAGGQAVANQTQADSFASRLDAAFDGLTFYNNRPISNFSATGNFYGGSASVQLSDFSDVRIDSINVTAPSTSVQDGVIDITINGTVFRANSGIGGSIGAYEAMVFTSLENANETLTLINGATAQSFSGSTSAATFETALRSAFGLNVGGSGVSFQIGESSDDTLQVVVGSATTDSLFNGITPSIESQTDAALAQTYIDTAKDTLLGIIANVGALQQRLEDTSTNISNSITGIEAARSQLADTDVAAESTALALATVRVNAGISVIAQATKLQSSLLGVLQAGAK